MAASKRMATCKTLDDAQRVQRKLLNHGFQTQIIPLNNKAVFGDAKYMVEGWKL